MTETITWPRKTREFHNHHFDSTIWNDFDFRDDDIIISTYAKSGTTWMQQIVGQLIFGSMSIEQIAYGLGFMDAAYFTRFFRKHTGVSPKVFRANYLKKIHSDQPMRASKPPSMAST